MTAYAKAAVYVMSATDGRVKVGQAQDVEARRRQLQCTAKTKLTIVFASEPTERALWVEKNALTQLRRLVGKKRGEWFHLETDIAVTAVKRSLMDSLGITEFKKIKENMIPVRIELPTSLLDEVEEFRRSLPYPVGRANALRWLAAEGIKILQARSEAGEGRKRR